MLSIAVLGPGGVGGFLAAALARAQPSRAQSPVPAQSPVRIIAREETAELIAAHGLRVQSLRLGDFTVAVPAQACLTDPVDVLVVATKAGGLLEALTRVRAEPRLVVPLLNGLEHMEQLRARFGRGKVAAGSIRIEADRPQAGVIVQTSPFLRVEMAGDQAGVAERLPPLAEALEAAGVPALVRASEAAVLWSKLVRLVALATTTSAADAPIGMIRSDPLWRERLSGVIREAAAVAACEGATVDPGEQLAELDEAHPGLGSSMQRDIAAGRVPELDAIAGAVLRAGQRHGLACPVLSELAREVAARAGIPPPGPAPVAA